MTIGQSGFPWNNSWHYHKKPIDTQTVLYRYQGYSVYIDRVSVSTRYYRYSTHNVIFTDTCFDIVSGKSNVARCRRTLGYVREHLSLRFGCLSGYKFEVGGQNHLPFLPYCWVICAYFTIIYGATRLSTFGHIGPDSQCVESVWTCPATFRGGVGYVTDMSFSQIK